jgi:hypothetical protein
MWRRLYGAPCWLSVPRDARHGFVEWGPFGDAVEDASSVFMTLELGRIPQATERDTSASSAWADEPSPSSR